MPLFAMSPAGLLNIDHSLAVAEETPPIPIEIGPFGGTPEIWLKV